MNDLYPFVVDLDERLLFANTPGEVPNQDVMHNPNPKTHLAELH
jgi:hypothetical protein